MRETAQRWQDYFDKRAEQRRGQSGASLGDRVRAAEQADADPGASTERSKNLQTDGLLQRVPLHRQKKTVGFSQPADTLSPAELSPRLRDAPEMHTGTCHDPAYRLSRWETWAPRCAMNEHTDETSLYSYAPTVSLGSDVVQPRQRRLTMSRIPAALEVATAAAAALDRRIKTVGTRRSAALAAVPKRTPSASLRRMMVVLLLATAPASLFACSHSNGELQFGGNPFWQPPGHISDNGPN
jgi:hypothetical protein